MAPQIKYPQMDKEFLEREYVKNKRTLIDIGNEIGCPHETVRIALTRLKIPIREKIKDFAGKTFGKWFVKERCERGWNCICECGTEQRIDTNNLLIGRTLQCRKCKTWHKGAGEISQAFFLKMKHSAKERDIKVEVTIEFIWDLFLKQDRKCALSGMPIYFSSRDGYSENTASLDRIDSSKCYSENNIQWVHKDVNRMKSNFTEEYFFQMCQNVINNQKQKKEKHEK